jgi:hypothetical protein
MAAKKKVAKKAVKKVDKLTAQRGELATLIEKVNRVNG